MAEYGKNDLVCCILLIALKACALNQCLGCICMSFELLYSALLQMPSFIPPYHPLFSRHKLDTVYLHSNIDSDSDSFHLHPLNEQKHNAKGNEIGLQAFHFLKPSHSFHSV